MIETKNLKSLTTGDNEIKNRIREAIDKVKLVDLAKFVQTEVDNQLQNVEFNYSIRCFRQDGANAINKAIVQVLGYSSQQNGKSDKPPTTIDVTFADGTSIKVPWGTINTPVLGKDSYIIMGYNEKDRIMVLSGVCQRRYQQVMDLVVKEMRKILKTDSIYRGKAIKMGVDLNPIFLDLSKAESMDMFLSSETRYSLTPIEVRINDPKGCRKKNIDLSFGTLLAGSYGEVL